MARRKSKKASFSSPSRKRKRAARVTLSNSKKGGTRNVRKSPPNRGRITRQVTQSSASRVSKPLGLKGSVKPLKLDKRYKKAKTIHREYSLGSVRSLENWAAKKRKTKRFAMSMMARIKEWDPENRRVRSRLVTLPGLYWDGNKGNIQPMLNEMAKFLAGNRYGLPIKYQRVWIHTIEKQQKRKSKK